MEDIPASEENRPSKNLLLLNAQALKLLSNVTAQCYLDLINNELKEAAVDDYKVRVYLYTGAPVNVVENIENDTPEVSGFNWEILIAIRSILKTYYSKRELPLCKDLFDKLRLKRSNITVYKDFKLQIIELGYEYVTMSNGRMIMENPKLTFERYRYLKKIISFREAGTKVYYLSVKMYDNNKKSLVPFKEDIAKKLESDSNLLLWYHMVSIDGYEKGFYSYNFEPERFFKWVMHIVMPALNPLSLIVLDKSLHYEKHENDISRYHTKTDMIKWLKSHNIPCDPNMHKAELYEIIQKYSVKPKTNNLENVLKSAGHNVLQLPDQIYDLSLSQLLMKDINKALNVAFENEMGSIVAAKDQISNRIPSLGSTDWKTFDNVVTFAEQKLLALDKAIDNHLENYELDFEATDCDSDKRWQNIIMP